MLVHDAAVLDDPGLSDALARAARLAAANARLQAEVRMQLDELAESRRRLVHAGDEERRRLERRLHETVERRLTALADRLEEAEPGSSRRRAPEPGPAAARSCARRAARSRRRASPRRHRGGRALRRARIAGRAQPGTRRSAHHATSACPRSSRERPTSSAQRRSRTSSSTPTPRAPRSRSRSGRNGCTSRSATTVWEARCSATAVGSPGSPIASRRSTGHSRSIAPRGVGRACPWSCRSGFRSP